jgi:hypothetical protein
LPCFRIDAHQLAGNSLQATGCQWRALPKDYPPWKQVCNTFARWRQRGVWDVLLALLRQQVHAKAGRRAKYRFPTGCSPEVKQDGSSQATSTSENPG